MLVVDGDVFGDFGEMQIAQLSVIFVKLEPVVSLSFIGILLVIRYIKKDILTEYLVGK